MSYIMSIPDNRETLRASYFEWRDRIWAIGDEIDDKRTDGGDLIQQLYEQNGIPYDTVQIGEDGEGIVVAPEHTERAHKLHVPLQEIIDKGIDILTKQKEQDSSE